MIDQQEYLSMHPQPVEREASDGKPPRPANRITHMGLELNLELKPITQRMMERFFDVQRELGNDPNRSLPEYYGNVLRAAVGAGFFNGDLGDVGEMAPAAVQFVGRELAQRVQAALEIPPE